MNCQKRCKGDGRIQLDSITKADWQWFNYPEGTTMFYENNLGEKDTAVFGPIYTTEERCCHFEEGCYTIVNQSINQKIDWLHNLKGMVRPVALSTRGRSIGIAYSDGNVTSLDNSTFIDSAYYKNQKYNDVYKTCCSYGCLINCEFLSKTAFLLEISYKFSNNTIETWQRK